MAKVNILARSKVNVGFELLEPRVFAFEGDEEEGGVVPGESAEKVLVRNGKRKRKEWEKGEKVAQKWRKKTKKGRKRTKKDEKDKKGAKNKTNTHKKTQNTHKTLTKRT